MPSSQQAYNVAVLCRAEDLGAEAAKKVADSTGEQLIPGVMTERPCCVNCACTACTSGRFQVRHLEVLKTKKFVL